MRKSAADSLKAKKTSESVFETSRIILATGTSKVYYLNFFRSSNLGGLLPELELL